MLSRTTLVVSRSIWPGGFDVNDASSSDAQYYSMRQIILLGSKQDSLPLRATFYFIFANILLAPVQRCTTV
jgi:hypothetical protein